MSKFSRQLQFELRRGQTMLCAGHDIKSTVKVPVCYLLDEECNDVIEFWEVECEQFGITVNEGTTEKGEIEYEMSLEKKEE